MECQHSKSIWRIYSGSGGIKVSLQTTWFRATGRFPGYPSPQLHMAEGRELPTDEEWSCALSLVRSCSLTMIERDQPRRSNPTDPVRHTSFSNLHEFSFDAQ